MGELIVLKDQPAYRARLDGRAGRRRAAFFFDLGSPLSYLAAERLERAPGEVDWIPAAPLDHAGPARDAGELRARAEACGRGLRIPLVWPERWPARCPRALRAAAYAAEIGAGARFALAAGRLAFCGGFDLEDAEILSEAAAAAAIPLDPCLQAADDAGRDHALDTATRRLSESGVRRLPALRLGRRWFEAEQAIGDGAALLSARAL